MFGILLRLALLGCLVVVAYAWVRRGLSRTRRARREVQKAAEAFARDPNLGERFRAAAQATGKPRGLRWTRCDLSPEPPRLARDTATGELVALAGVTIGFEAIPDGDMVEVEAVGDLRDGTAVFVWRGGRWETDGRAVFNLPPDATLTRYADSLSPVEAPPRLPPPHGRGVRP